MAEQEIRYTKQGLPWPQPLQPGSWRIVRLVSGALLVLLVVLSAYFVLHAPATMITKLDDAGAVVAYGSRWSFLLLPICCTGVYAVLGKLLVRPDIMSFGRVIITEENYRKQYDLARKFTACLRVLILLLANILTYTMAQTAGLAPVFLPDFAVTVLWVAIVLAVLAWRMGTDQVNRRMQRNE